MRLLGLDYGTVRVGVAMSDQLGYIAQPKGFIDAVAKKKCIEKIIQMCNEFDIKKIVIGLPLHMNGDEGESALGARTFGKKINKKIDIPIEFIDERLSTMSANKALTEGNVKGEKRKEKVDSVAAAIILQNYIDRETEISL